MSCKYCSRKDNDLVLINQTAEYSGLDIEINRQGILRVRCYNDEMDGFVSQDIVNINYCPMCGRKLTEENNNE